MGYTSYRIVKEKGGIRLKRSAVATRMKASNPNPVDMLIKKIVTSEEDRVAFFCGYCNGMNLITQIGTINDTGIMAEMSEKHASSESFGLGILCGMSDTCIAWISKLKARQSDAEVEPSDDDEEEEVGQPPDSLETVRAIFRPNVKPRKKYSDDRDAA